VSQNDHHYGLRLPTELHERLTERARAEARTPAAVLRMLAELYLETPEGEPIYPPGTPRPHPPA
jgi:predicted DNA-binding protein